MSSKETDIAYIDRRMEAYHIKYQEVYDEIKDHMVSAVEHAREAGDNSNIAALFEEELGKHFPGYWAIDTISNKYRKAYYAKMRRTIWANMKYYLDIKAIILIAIVTAIGFYLPHDVTVSGIFVSIMLVAAFVLFVYVFRATRVIKQHPGRRSLAKAYIIWCALILLVFINVLLNLVGMIARELNIRFLDPRYFHPGVYILMLSVFVIYCLGTVRLCKQELRLRRSN